MLEFGHVLAEPGDMVLLGIRTTEGFGVMVDGIGHRFVATMTIVAAQKADLKVTTVPDSVAARKPCCFR
jgi:hypothetical protein